MLCLSLVSEYLLHLSAVKWDLPQQSLVQNQPYHLIIMVGSVLRVIFFCPIPVFLIFYATRGGNMDTKHITKGSKLYLPVQVKGALFSLGDGHAAQGDGECCGKLNRTT
jgi:hypothetical protein